MGDRSVTLARAPDEVVFPLELGAQLQFRPLTFQLGSDFRVATHDGIIVPGKSAVCEIVSLFAEGCNAKDLHPLKVLLEP